MSNVVSFIGSAGVGTTTWVSSANPLPVTGGGNAAASPTGAAVPADADYIGFSSGGDLVGVSSSNPLPVTGSFSAAATAPYQATAVASSQMGLEVVTATSLTVPATATFALINVEGTNVRWRDDGTAPTASVGFVMYAGAIPQMFSGDLAAVKFIQTAATATINVAYYR